MGRKIAVLLMLLVVMAPIFADDAVYTQVLSLDEAITYGDSSFRERILARTGGSRDPLALVMTGSWSRACVHIGVLEYLEEQSVYPDLIITSSASAPVAILYAAGAAPEDIARLLGNLDISAAVELTFPIAGGFADPSSLQAVFETVLGKDTVLSDLRIPVMIIAEDLVTKREIRIAEGDASELAVAAMAYPSLFPPQEYRGHLIIDSSSVTETPLDAAYQYTDTVILSTAFDQNPDLNLLDPLNASATAIAIQQKAYQDISGYDGLIWINSNTAGYSTLDFAFAAEIAEIGYESAASSAPKLDKGAAVFPMSFRTGKRNLVTRAISSSCFGRIAPADDAHTLFMMAGYGPLNQDKRYLSGAFDIAVRYKYRNKWVEGGAFGGVAIDSQSFNAGGYPVIGGDVAFYPIPSLRISLDVQTEFMHDIWYIPELYVHQGADWVAMKESWYDFSVFESIEYRTGFSAGSEAFLLDGGVQGSVQILPWLGVYGDISYLMTADSIAFANLRHFMDFDIGARFDIPQLDNQLYFRTEVMTRFALDGKGQIPLFQRDGYTSNEIGRNEDYYNHTADPGQAMAHATLIRLLAAWDIPQEPSLNGMLFLEDSEIGVYCDMLIRDSAFTVSTGIELQTAISIIKAARLPLRLRLGYDSWSNGFVSSFFVSLNY